MSNSIPYIHHPGGVSTAPAPPDRTPTQHVHVHRRTAVAVLVERHTLVRARIGHAHVAEDVQHIAFGDDDAVAPPLVRRLRIRFGRTRDTRRMRAHLNVDTRIRNGRILWRICGKDTHVHTYTHNSTLVHNRTHHISSTHIRRRKTLHCAHPARPSPTMRRTSSSHCPPVCRTVAPARRSY